MNILTVDDAVLGEMAVTPDSEGEKKMMSLVHAVAPFPIWPPRNGHILPPLAHLLQLFSELSKDFASKQMSKLPTFHFWWIS